MACSAVFHLFVPRFSPWIWFRFSHTFAPGFSAAGGPPRSVDRAVHQGLRVEVDGADKVLRKSGGTAALSLGILECHLGCIWACYRPWPHHPQNARLNSIVNMKTLVSSVPHDSVQHALRYNTMCFVRKRVGGNKKINPVIRLGATIAPLVLFVFHLLPLIAFGFWHRADGADRGR